MTGEESTGIVIDSTLSIYNNYYCTKIENGVCTESITIYSLNRTDIKEMGVEILSVTVAFGVSVVFVLWLIKGLFRLIIPGKGRK